MNELVSVIIPTYNREKFVLEAIDSAIQQTYNNIEIIIVDDGSSDNTKEVVNKYINTHNIFYYFIDNSGVANARNFGISKCKGKYIAFLDSDDIWKPNKLEKQIDLFKQNSNLGLVHSCYTIILDNKYITKFAESPKSYQGMVFEQMIQFNMVATSTVVVKKECIDKVGFFEQEYSPCEDYDLWVRISKLYEFGYINESLAFYREDSSENISKNLKKLEIGTFKVLDKNWASIKDDKLLELKGITYSRFYSYLSTYYYEQNNKDKFLEYYLKSIEYGISNYISLPNSSESIYYLIKNFKDKNDKTNLSYLHLRLSRQLIIDKKILSSIFNIVKCLKLDTKIFTKFFLEGFLQNFLKKRIIKF